MSEQPESRSVMMTARDPQLMSLRPTRLGEFIGQDALKKNLATFIDSARQREQSLDHVLLAGPPGLGKTTLAHIVSNELGVGFRVTSGPVVARGGDLAAILTNLQPRDVLFIDEIHRLNPAVEEVLYPAMEDFGLDLVVGTGPMARSVRIDLPPFTLIGATTRAGMITTPLRERFGIPLQLQYYDPAILATIVQRAAALLALDLSGEAAIEIAQRARGTPRVAGRLLRRIQDFATVQDIPRPEQPHIAQWLEQLEIDAHGLDPMDHRYLRLIAESFGGGPVGVETLAAALSEERGTVEDVLEPYLIQCDYIARTARGRVLRPLGYTRLGLTPPPKTDEPPLL
ncbi:MAG: Holliday junction branch migration DNA helicase RuvB [Pseudomonadota bacterium]